MTRLRQDDFGGQADREIPQALARRMAKLIEETFEPMSPEWHLERGRVMRELRPPDPVAEAVDYLNRCSLSQDQERCVAIIVGALAALKTQRHRLKTDGDDDVHNLR